MAALAHPELREFMGELIVVRLVENTNCYRKRCFMSSTIASQSYLQLTGDTKMFPV